MLFFGRRLFEAWRIETDNVVFRLHYKVTTPILITFGIIILFFQYLRNPMDCISKDDIPSSVINSYCWTHSTFSIKEAWGKKVGQEVPYPGVDKYRPRQEVVYNHFYHWMGFALLLQAFSFYLPRYVWKRLESKRITFMMSDLNTALYTPENRNAAESLLSDYFVSRFNRHMCYAVLYAMCEVLNVINVFTQIFLITVNLSGPSGSFGVAVFKFLRWDGSLRSPMVEAFPGMAKCLFYRYGSSGDVQGHDALCVLPINAIAEKMYMFLWFWLIILLILSVIAVVYRAILFLISSFRNTVLLIRARLPQEQSFKDILNKSNVGDWFMLDLMCTNLDSVSFRDVIQDIAIRLSGKVPLGI